MLKRIIDVIYVFEKWVSVILISFAFSLTFLQVVLRYFFNTGLAWVPEIVVFSFIIFTLASTSTGVRSHVHVGVDVIVKLMPARWQHWCRAFSNLCGAVLFLFMAWATLQFVLYFRDMGQVSIITEIPIWWMISYIPFSFLFTSMHYVELLTRSFRPEPEPTVVASREVV
jgi:C4-dicarboxylate transporter DctQ subunit